MQSVTDRQTDNNMMPIVADHTARVDNAAEKNMFLIPPVHTTCSYLFAPCVTYCVSVSLIS